MRMLSVHWFFSLIMSAKLTKNFSPNRLKSTTRRRNKRPAALLMLVAYILISSQYSWLVCLFCCECNQISLTSDQQCLPHDVKSSPVWKTAIQKYFMLLFNHSENCVLMVYGSHEWCTAFNRLDFEMHFGRGSRWKTRLAQDKRTSKVQNY